MFIAQAYHGKNSFRRYLIGSIIVGGVAIAGQFLFLIAILFKVAYGGKSDSVLDNIQELQNYTQNDIMNIFDSNVTFILLLSSFVFGFIAFVLVIKYLHKQRLKDVTTTRKKFDWSRFFFTFTLIVVFSIVTTAIDYYFNPQDYGFNFKPVPFLILFFSAAILIPIQTSLEEYVFRGYLMQGFGILAKNRWFPLVLTSVIFGSMHLFNPEVAEFGYVIMVYYIGTGFLLGIMTLMDEGMELSLGFHAANNLIAALLITSEWSVFQTEAVLIDLAEPSTGIDVVLPVLITYPIFLLILARRYKWTDWKQKLIGKIDPPPATETFIN